MCGGLRCALTRPLFCILRWFLEENPIYVSLKPFQAQQKKIRRWFWFNKSVQLKTIRGRKSLGSSFRFLRPRTRNKSRIQLDEESKRSSGRKHLDSSGTGWKKTCCCYERKKPKKANKKGTSVWKRGSRRVLGKETTASHNEHRFRGLVLTTSWKQKLEQLQVVAWEEKPDRLSVWLTRTDRLCAVRLGTASATVVRVPGKQVSPIGKRHLLRNKSRVGRQMAKICFSIWERWQHLSYKNKKEQCCQKNGGLKI